MEPEILRRWTIHMTLYHVPVSRFCIRIVALNRSNSTITQPIWKRLYLTGAWESQRNWVFATNSDFLITISLEPNAADLRYFKLWILQLGQIIWVCLQYRVLKILRFKYLILFQRLNSFAPIIILKLIIFLHIVRIVCIYTGCSCSNEQD